MSVHLNHVQVESTKSRQSTFAIKLTFKLNYWEEVTTSSISMTAHYGIGPQTCQMIGHGKTEWARDRDEGIK